MISKEIREKYQEVIGLEVHIQLLTKTKAYSSDINEYGSLPNTNISVITLAHPGALPRSNKTVIEYAMKLGLSCGSEITRFNSYDRKNYFYPDLPKGYQLTQDRTPVCQGGTVPIKTKAGMEKIIQLERIHMEEDAGKSMHLEGEEDSLIDLNRAGVPLLEMVTKPDLRNSDEAYAFLGEVRKLVRYLEVSDGNMEEGSLRCDANISVMPKGSTTFGTRVEVKNMNSFRNVQRAIDYEIERQIELIEKGDSIDGETRLFDATKGKTYSMRTKEQANDYRYFPEPDLQPVVISDEWLKDMQASMPPLPRELLEKFTGEYGIPEYDALVLTDSKEIALYFEAVCQSTTNYKAASNWVMGPVKSYLNELTLHINDFPVPPEKTSAVIALIDAGKISNSAASQKLFPELIRQPEKSPEKLAEALGLIQDSNSDAIQPIIEEVLAAMPEKVAEYKNGKKGLVGLFMGEVMKKSKGKADPRMANELLKKMLDN